MYGRTLYVYMLNKLLLLLLLLLSAGGAGPSRTYGVPQYAPTATEVQ